MSLSLSSSMLSSKLCFCFLLVVRWKKGILTVQNRFTECRRNRHTNTTTRRLGRRTEVQTFEVLVRYDRPRRKPLRPLLVELELGLHKLTVSCQSHLNWGRKIPINFIGVCGMQCSIHRYTCLETVILSRCRRKKFSQ